MNDKLDFSRFHGLDHRIGSRFCREMPNFPDAPHGWSNVALHARYWWAFKGRETLHRRTLCRVGRHRPVTWYRARREFRDELRGTLPPRNPDPADPRYESLRSCAACFKDLS